MASFSNFQSDNNKYTTKLSRVNSHNPDFTPAIAINGISQKEGFEKNQKKWADVVSYLRWFPDLFWDLITPKTGGIRLDLDQRVFLRALARFPNGYYVFGRAYGKCVADDTLIITSNGIKEIGSFFNYQDDNVETIYENNINIVNRYGVIEPSNKGVYSGKKKTIKIRTREGFEIEGTYVHPILVINEYGNLEYKQLSHLKVGDYVCISRGSNVWGHDLDIDMSQQLSEWLSSLPKNCTNKLNIRSLPIKITEDIAYYIGILLGDGWCTSKIGIGFSNVDEDVLDRFFNISKHVLKVKYIRKANKNDYLIFDVYLRKYLELLGLGYGGAHHKEIPAKFMCAPKNIIVKLLQGLFDTDGCAEKKLISYCTVSKKLSKQIQTLLLNFGIIASVKKNIDKNGFYSYNIYINSDNIDIFNKEIGFLCKRKRERAEILGKRSRNTNIDVVPYQSNRMSIVCRALSYKIRKKFYHCCKRDKGLTYNKLCELLKTAECSEETKHLQHLFELNYFYSKIVDIQHGEAHVYDLQVPITHSFIANGFVNHNTMLEVMGLIHTAIFFPRIKLSLTAQTKKKAADILKAKYSDLLNFYPLLKEEIYSARFRGDESIVEFHNGSIIDVLANHDNTKGERRHRGSIEEDNLVDERVYKDAVKPVFDDPRRTIGKFGKIDPNENNSSINSFTTSGYRGSPAYHRCKKTYEGMLNLDGSFCIGASWKLPAFNGRGKDINEILKDRRNESPFVFDMNYMSRWTGSGDEGICNVAKLLECRNLPKAELSSQNAEVILSVDVAQSDKDKNCQTIITVLDVIRLKNGRIKEIRVPEIISINGKLNYTAQSIDVKRAKNKYNASIIVVDNNGLGRGLTQELLKEQIDPKTGDKLDCLDTINTEDLPEFYGAEKCVFAYLAQSFDQESIPIFMECVETGKLRLLEVKDYSDFENYTQQEKKQKILPFIQTTFLVDEIQNIVLKVLNNGKLSIARATTRLQKDRFSSLQYGLWYVMKFMDNVIQEEDDDVDYLLSYLNY